MANFGILSGIVGYAEAKDTKAGLIYVLSVGDTYKGNTSWIRVTAFGKTAEFASKHIKKGDAVEVGFRLQNQQYEKDGKTVNSLQVIANTINWCPRGKGKSDEGDVDTGATTHTTKDDDDDIPF
jgi:single-strand DNA-binding protein